MADANTTQPQPQPPAAASASTPTAVSAQPPTPTSAPASAPVPDAIILPLGWRGKSGIALDREVKAVWGPVFGGKALWTRNQASYYYITADPTDSLLFPTEHALAKKSRYQWVDGDEPGVLLGYLVPEAKAKAGANA